MFNNVPESKENSIFIVKMNQSLITDINIFKLQLVESLDQKTSHISGEKPVVINLEMKYNAIDFTEFTRELDILNLHFGIE